MTKFMNFIRDEDGAVTLDWVALSAGVVLLGIAVIAALQGPLSVPWVRSTAICRMLPARA